MGCCCEKSCIKCGCPLDYYTESRENIVRFANNKMNCQIHREMDSYCIDCGKGKNHGGNCRHIF